jgi:putative ABC transport system substrate-binding protein
MGVSADPVAAGFVQSLARPGGNVTGVSILSPGITAKQIELLKKLVPTATRIGLLMNPQNPSTERQVADSRAGGETIGVEVYLLPVQSGDELDVAFQTAVDQQLNALVMVGDPIFTMERARLRDLLLRHKLPASVNPEHIEAAGLLSYAPSVEGLLYQSAGYVDKILKGANPGDLPVQQPTRFDLIVNHRTVESLGIAVPEDIMVQAARVIQ